MQSSPIAGSDVDDGYLSPASNHLQAGMAFVIMQGLEIGFPEVPEP